MLIPVLLIIIVILILQLIDNVHETAVTCASIEPKIKVRREVAQYISEREQKRKEVERKHFEKLRKEQLELNKLKLEERKELKEKLQKKIEAAIILNEHELANRLKEDLDMIQ